MCVVMRDRRCQGVVEPTPKFHKVTPHSHCIRQCGTLLTVRVGGVALRSRPSRFPLLPGAVLSCSTSPVTLRRRSADRAQQSMAGEPTQPSHVRGYTGDRAWNCRGQRAVECRDDSESNHRSSRRSSSGSSGKRTLSVASPTDKRPPLIAECRADSESNHRSPSVERPLTEARADRSRHERQHSEPTQPSRVHG